MAITTPKTRTYYGEYTLEHWINLILSKNIVLPEYQRSFAWSEERIKRFIVSLYKGDYVPPVIIAAGQENTERANLILDGQQRLTSILLAALGRMPNRDKWQDETSLMDEDMRGDEEDEQGARRQDDLEGGVVAWSFRAMLEGKGNRSRVALKEELTQPEYKDLALPEGIDLEELLKNRLLGFLYIVPDDDSADSQQIFTKLFYTINYEGVKLSKVESRKALYYQDLTMTNFFEGRLENKLDVLCDLHVSKGAVGSEKIDWLRYLSILSQKSLVPEPLAGYRKEASREDFYKDYVSYILELDQQDRVDKFDGFREKLPFKDGVWKQRYCILRDQVAILKEKIGQFTSVIDADYWLFGLIYMILFEGKTSLVGSPDELGAEIQMRVKAVKKKHQDRPNQLTHLRQRLNESIEIYKKYVS